MKYPFEIASSIMSVKGESKAFSVEAHFTRRTDDKPIQIFDDNFSRFRMQILIGKSSAYCNIPVDELAGIVKKTDFAMNKFMDSKYSQAPAEEGSSASPAFTARFASGTLKGKTPAEVLAENGTKGKDILNKQYSWLKENLAKYPNNQKLMDAIVAASKLTEEELKKNVSVSPVSRPVSIIDIDCRPLVRKKREDGKCFCYEAYVTWDITKNYPVNVKIVNYYAPVLTRENGALNVQIAEKDKSSEIVNEFNMTAECWLNIVEEMQIKKSGFEYIYLKSAIELAQSAAAKEIEDAKKREKEEAKNESGNV